MTGRGDVLAVRVAVWLYRMFARLLPTGLREAYGHTLVADFRRLAQRSHERLGVAGAAAAAVRGCADIVYRAPVEHWRERRAPDDSPSRDLPSVGAAGPGARDLVATG